MSGFDPDLLPPGLRDVTVREGAVRVPVTAEHRGVLWRAEHGRFWLHVPEVADYLVEDGASVTVAPIAGADRRAVEDHLLAAPLAVLWMMRGVAVLDAAVAVGPHGAVAVCGHAGAGKSSLVATLLERGWDLLADGIAPVTVADGAVHCLPATRSVVPWGEPPAAGRHWTEAAAPLVALIALSEGNRELTVSPDRAGLERFVRLHEIRYMGPMTAALLGNDAFLRTAAAVGRSDILMVDATRPAKQDTREVLGDLAERIAATRTV